MEECRSPPRPPTKCPRRRVRPPSRRPTRTPCWRRTAPYVTYGTTVGAGTGARCGATGRLYVPALVHGSGNSVGMADCASHDALPSGQGAWAVAWHWWNGSARFPMTGVLTRSSTGFLVS